MHRSFSTQGTDVQVVHTLLWLASIRFPGLHRTAAHCTGRDLLRLAQDEKVHGPVLRVLGHPTVRFRLTHPDLQLLGNAVRDFFPKTKSSFVLASRFVRSTGNLCFKVCVWCKLVCLCALPLTHQDYGSDVLLSLQLR